MRWGVSKAPTVGPRAQVREEGERGLGASGCLSRLWEGPVCGFPPSALQARNCSTKPLPPPTAGQETLLGLGRRFAPRLLPTCYFLGVGEIKTWSKLVNVSWHRNKSNFCDTGLEKTELK